MLGGSADEAASEDGDDSAADPHNAEDDLEEESLIVGVSRDAEHRSEHQAKEKRTPEVPVANLLPLRFSVDLGERVDHDSQFLPDPFQIAFLFK